jgi:hypothetical protein
VGKWLAGACLMLQNKDAIDKVTKEIFRSKFSTEIYFSVSKQ